MAIFLAVRWSLAFVIAFAGFALYAAVGPVTGIGVDPPAAASGELGVNADFAQGQAVDIRQAVVFDEVLRSPAEGLGGDVSNTMTDLTSTWATAVHFVESLPPVFCPLPGSTFRDSFGEPRSGGRSHAGVDMVAPYGTPILAPISGVVTQSSGGLGGNGFTLKSGNLQMYGAHLSSYGASGYVEAGTIVGYVGDTGHAYGPHLHFEIKENGATQNPYYFVAQWC